MKPNKWIRGSATILFSSHRESRPVPEYPGFVYHVVEWPKIEWLFGTVTRVEDGWTWILTLNNMSHLRVAHGKTKSEREAREKVVKAMWVYRDLPKKGSRK